MKCYKQQKKSKETTQSQILTHSLKRRNNNSYREPTHRYNCELFRQEVKQNDASLDCLLRNATEGDYIEYLLQKTGKNM